MAIEPGMLHWNRDILCVINIKTTGDDPFEHEIYDIAILPLNYKLEPYIMPFNIFIRPEFPDRIDTKAKSREREAIQNACRSGMDRYFAQDLLKEWLPKLNLASTAYGYHKIIPLGYQYCKKYPFLLRWLGQELYTELFNEWPVDLASVARFMNDRSGSHNETMFFGKIFLKYLASTLGFIVEKNDALQEAITTAAVYKKLVSRGIMA